MKAVIIQTAKEHHRTGHKSIVDDPGVSVDIYL